jgi:hypothetical protein
MLGAMMAAGLLMQQVVWGAPAAAPAPEPEPAPAAAAASTVPDWGRADPFAWERSQCSPLVRPADEAADACQARVRATLRAELDEAALQAAMRTQPMEECGPAGEAGRYQTQCLPRERATQATPTAPPERRCDVRPQRTGRDGAVGFQEVCEPRPGEQQGLRINLGGRD